MNPFSGTLTRSGFLLWSALLMAWVIGFGMIIDATKAHHAGAYWLPLRLIWATILLAVSLLVFVRRLQNAGLNVWFSVLYFVPFISVILWVALFFLPPKPHSQPAH